MQYITDLPATYMIIKLMPEKSIWFIISSMIWWIKISKQRKNTFWNNNSPKVDTFTNQTFSASVYQHELW
jgi:hypothetical protein